MAATPTFKRLQLAVYDSAASVISSVLAFANTLLAVSLTIGYLGEERFGIWMTVVSISTMLSFMDFGVANGMVSQIARSNVTKNPLDLARTATRGLTILTAIGVLVWSTLTLANTFFPVADMLNTQTEKGGQDAKELITMFIALFALYIPLNGFFKIMQGLQKGWIVHVTRSCGSLLSLLLIFILASQETDPVWLLLASYGVTALAPIVLLPYFIKHSMLTWSANTDWPAAKAEYRNLLNFGGLFLILHLGIMVGWGSDSFIISALTSVAAVAPFAIMQRLFQLVSIPMSIVNTPLWGAYADAHAQGDEAFIRKIMMASLTGTLILSASLSTLLYFTADSILTLWIKDHIEIPRELILAFAIWSVLSSIGNSLSMALNGMHIVKVQVYSVLLLCALTIPLKMYYTPEYGALGVVWSTIIAYTLSTILFYPIVFRKVLYRELFQQQIS